MKTKSLLLITRVFVTLILTIAVGFTSVGKAAAAWPKRPVEFVISAGTGGGADRYARFIVGLNIKNKYISEAMLPVNRTGGAGAVAMDYVFKQKGNGYVILITLNSFITTPIFQSLPWSFRDFTPIALLALDNFPLWVHKDSHWKDIDEFIAEARKRSITVGGTGSKQEDEIVFRAIEKLAKTKPFKYVPYKGGGAVAKSLVGKHSEATVNQVSEAGPFYPEHVRPLVVFQDKRLDMKGYENVRTGKEVGIPFSYNMMRGIFAPPAMSDEARKGLVGLFEKIHKDPDWQGFLTKAGLKPTFITGDKLISFLEDFEKLHIKIMKEQGWIK
jgi:tripartite-type tricarboxylate transporter receptor subunit TctC